MSNQLLQGDCLEKMKDIPDESVDAVIADPPYNIGKASWDKIDNYLTWCEKWIAEASRICKQQGAFWCFHSEPFVLSDIGRIIEKYGRSKQNWITWDKYNESGNHYQKGFLDGYTLIGGLKRFQDFAEYIVYHADDGQWQNQSDKCRGFIFEPLRRYLDNERIRCGLSRKEVDEIWQRERGTKGNMTPHWFGSGQWGLPTYEHYNFLYRLFNDQDNGEYLQREYEDLKHEYEDLRREYEYLRPTFNNPGKISSVWQFPPAKSEGHPTTKPVPLLERIVEATTDSDDTVLDPFAGSGTTGIACKNLNRNFIGIEISKEYYEIAKKRINKNLQKQPLNLI